MGVAKRFALISDRLRTRRDHIQPGERGDFEFGQCLHQVEQRLGALLLRGKELVFRLLQFK